MGVYRVSSNFRRKVELNLGCAVILAGSGSDEAHIDKIAASLNRYSVPFEVRIASAHKQGRKLPDTVREYDGWKGALAYIAVAGDTDALSGTVSFISHRPTISCPPDHPNHSCINNPPGSSNAYVARAENLGRFVAQMFSSINPQYHRRIQEEVEAKVKKLEADDERLRVKYGTINEAT